MVVCEGCPVADSVIGDDVDGEAIETTGETTTGFTKEDLACPRIRPRERDMTVGATVSLDCDINDVFVAREKPSVAGGQSCPSSVVDATIWLSDRE